MKNRFSDIRKKLGLSQAQLAAMLGMTPGNVSHIETGRQILTLDNAVALVGVCRNSGLSVGLDDIFIYPETTPKTNTQESD